MEGFNVTRFHELMEEATTHHRAGEHAQALRVTVRAYELAPQDSPEAGDAARDMSARHDRLGNFDDAEHWSEVAFATHNRIVVDSDNPGRQDFRRRGISAMYVGVSGLRRVLSDSLGDQPGSEHDQRTARNYMDLAWQDIQHAKALAPRGINRKVDQYEINAVRRVSLVNTLTGDRVNGLRAGVRAIRLAFWSESPKLDTANPSLAATERFHAKSRALLGGIASLAVGLSCSYKPGRRRRLAAALADKVL